MDFVSEGLESWLNCRHGEFRKLKSQNQVIQSDPTWSPSWRSLNPWKGHVFTIPKRSPAELPGKECFFFFFLDHVCLVQHPKPEVGLGNGTLPETGLRGRQCSLLWKKRAQEAFEKGWSKKDRNLKWAVFFWGLRKVFFETTMQLPSCKLT